MGTVLLASLRRNTRRYVASTIAVVIGVAFVMVTNGLSNATRDGLTRDAGAPYQAVDLVLEFPTEDEAVALMARAAEDGFPAGISGYAVAPVSRDGIELSSSADVGEVATDPAMQWQTLTAGRLPTGPGEAVVDHNAAKSNGAEIGDRLALGTGTDAVEVELVGLVDSPASSGSSVYLTWPDLRRLKDSLWIEAVAWGGGADLARRLAPEATLTDTEAYVAQRQADIARGVDYLAIMALLFVAIALFVAVMVIANTFSILFAQRMRDFALLRCVGVTRRQLRRSVRLEALLLGLVSSALGVLVGMLGGLGLTRLVGIWFDDIGEVSFGASWIVGALVLGTLVTLAAAWLPTRAVTRVTPLAALRPDTGVEVRSAAGRLRIGSAVTLLVLGTGVLAAAVAGDEVGATMLLMVAGGITVFGGVLLLGPLLVPALIRVAGRLLGDGPVRRLATGNAVRNPRRTATTAASLLVGVTLTTAVLTGLATSRSALAEEMDESNPLDASLTALEEPLPADLVTRVRAVEGVADAVALDGALARIGDQVVPLIGVGERPAVVRGTDDLAPTDGVIRLPGVVTKDLGEKSRRQWADDGTLDVVVGDRVRTLQVEEGGGWGTAGLVSAQTLAALSTDPVPTAVWVRATDDADPEDLRGDLAALAGPAGAAIAGGHQERAWVELQVDILTGSVVGLLGIAVVIALIGIGNTLGLSVLERSRENALLRAMGLTRTQLRRAMAIEGLLLSLVATLVGTALGVAFAWVGVEVMVADVVGGTAMTLPLGQLVLVVLVAALAGLAASVLPARRAARVAPAAGLAME
ncbi:FtsX-like permease family protein [Nocardioides sp. 616]|uniref:FtsX-like permease family protein n=1 Tax=Nocardioides sp. 616 TaxID=2268090 RepID=UPI000CE2B8C1|nr:FtsX-like permease family protein [Nocardioides sp. 616]